MGAVRVIPGTFLGVGEDFVSMLEFLELHSDFFLGETRFHELVWVALVKKKCKPFQGTSQTLTRDIQRQRLMVNVQLMHPGLTLHKFLKKGDQICELNYRGTKCEIGTKEGDQKCNFAKKKE